jgi:hypothetical protein
LEKHAVEAGLDRRGRIWPLDRDPTATTARGAGERVDWH